MLAPDSNSERHVHENETKFGLWKIFGCCFVPATWVLISPQATIANLKQNQTGKTRRNKATNPWKDL